MENFVIVMNNHQHSSSLHHIILHCQWNLLSHMIY